MHRNWTLYQIQPPYVYCRYTCTCLGRDDMLCLLDEYEICLFKMGEKFALCRIVHPCICMNIQIDFQFHFLTVSLPQHFEDLFKMEKEFMNIFTGTILLVIQSYQFSCNGICKFCQQIFTVLTLNLPHHDVLIDCHIALKCIVALCM